MSDVEGITAEETTEQDVENQPVVTEEAEAEEKDAEPSEPQEADDESENFEEKYENDPKFKAFIDKQKDDAIKAKESNRKMALKHREKTILGLKERIAELEAKEVKALDRSEFETEEEYEAAERKKAIQDELREEKLNDTKAALNAEVQEKLAMARDSFVEKETAYVKENPQYMENAAKVQHVLNMLPKDDKGAIQDPGAQAGLNYILAESDSGPALLNYLGANPEKFDVLLGKPPAWIVDKLKTYEKELSVPKETPAPEPLPKPLSKTRGTTKTGRTLDNADSVLEHLGLRGR